MKLAKVTLSETSATWITSNATYSTTATPILSFFSTYPKLAERLASQLLGLLPDSGTRTFTVSIVAETIPDEYIAEEFRG